MFVKGMEAPGTFMAFIVNLLQINKINFKCEIRPLLMSSKSWVAPIFTADTQEMGLMDLIQLFAYRNETNVIPYLFNLSQ